MQHVLRFILNPARLYLGSLSAVELGPSILQLLMTLLHLAAALPVDLQGHSARISVAAVTHVTQLRTHIL